MPVCWEWVFGTLCPVIRLKTVHFLNYLLKFSNACTVFPYISYF
jgi:hypothetical protein